MVCGCVGVCMCACVCMSFRDYANICWTLAERRKQQRQLGPKVLANNLTHGEFLISRYVRTLTASAPALHLPGNQQKSQWRENGAGDWQVEQCSFWADVRSSQKN